MVTAAYGFIDISSAPLSFGGLNELTFPVHSDRNVNGGKKSIENVRGIIPGISVEEGEGRDAR